MSEADKKDLPAAPELGQDAPRAAAQPLEITGTAVCPGAAFGHAQMLSEGDLEIPHFTIEKTQTRSEFTRLRAAVHTVDKELEELLNEISAEEDTPAEALRLCASGRQRVLHGSASSPSPSSLTSSARRRGRTAKT